MSSAWHEIHDHLMQSSSTLSFQRSFETIRRTGSPLAPFRDPAAVLDALHRSPGGSDQKNLVLAALVRGAQTGAPGADCALTLMLLALWPGLDAIRRRSVWRKIGTPDEVASDILVQTIVTIRGLDLKRVNWIAATILRNVERDMIRARQREADHHSVISEIDPDEVAGEHDAHDPALSHKRLHGDMRRLIGADATLVIRVALEGFSQVEVAIELGLSEAAARKRYQRATRKPEHWAQMQVYMHLTGITRALYLAVCKDTDALFAERVRNERDEAERLLARAERIIFAARPPARISDDPDWFQCRLCPHHDACHDDRLPERTCRSCLHVTPIEGGGWHCARFDFRLSLDDQRAGCPLHLFIPDLIRGEQIDADPEGAWVSYRKPDGSVWRDGAP